MTNRRGFIKKLGWLTSVGLLPSFSKAALANDWLHKAGHIADPDSPQYWDFVREAFHLESGLVYLNNGTMGPSPAVVEHAVVQKIQSVNSNLHYGGGHEARDSIAQMINAKGSEISLTHNTTEGINVVVWGLPLQKGDEVIITTHEHVGNAMPWINRSQWDGITIKTFKPALTAAEVLNQIESLISRKTKVISVPHISCTIGQRFPVQEICALAREKGIFTVIDGAHGAGALHLDMQQMQPDFYISCGHKWMLGPKGTGFVYVPEKHFEILKPVFAGAYTDKGYDISVSPPTFNGYAETAHRYDYGTQNAALHIGLDEAVKFNKLIGTEKVEERILALNNHLYEALAQMPEIELLSSSEAASRSMMLGFKHKGIAYNELSSKLMQQDQKFRVRQVPEAGLNSIRVSTHIYNSFEQLDAFIETLKIIG
ncbi:aminotransferase class V-fold PLP-dependent enzyme [bacterium]|nr:aminotransferase class V-fold PLP-dependent enzyme [bacterium]